MLYTEIGLQEYIRIRGARVHNLKNISLSLPHNQLTVITGVSGSGKSSLAFDTIYAEGQRRYVESLSAYARQFLERMEKPEVDEIDGIAPAIAIRQKNTTRNPRSTVATSTECYDFLRLLFARVGRTFCPNCGTRVERDTVDQVAARLLALPAGSRWYALFPVSAEAHPNTASAARPPLRSAQEGLQPAVSGRPHVRILHARIAARYRFLEARVRAGRSPRHPRRAPSCTSAWSIPSRSAIAKPAKSIFEAPRPGPRRHAALQREVRLQDMRHGPSSMPEPSLFSFNNPVRRLPALPGLRQHHRFRHGPGDSGQDSLSLEEGAVEPWTKPKYRSWLGNFRKTARGKACASTVPFCD